MGLQDSEGIQIEDRTQRDPNTIKCLFLGNKRNNTVINDYYSVWVYCTISLFVTDAKRSLFRSNEKKHGRLNSQLYQYRFVLLIACDFSKKLHRFEHGSQLLIILIHPMWLSWLHLNLQVKLYNISKQKLYFNFTDLTLEILEAYNMKFYHKCFMNW